MCSAMGIDSSPRCMKLSVISVRFDIQLLCEVSYVVKACV